MKNLQLQSDLPEFKKNAWMYSFMDLVLLLICFFIMIFAATRQLSKDSDKVFDSVREKFSANILYSENEGVNIIYDTLSSHIKHSNMSEYLDIAKENDKVSIIIPHKFLFTHDVINKEANKIADFLSNALFNITKNRIGIENQIDIDSMLDDQNTNLEIKIESATKNALKIQALLRSRGIRSSLYIKNVFKPVNYKNIEAVDALLLINIYTIADNAL
jgi:hypothetical protein